MPGKFDVTYTYANGVELICHSDGENGVKFTGSDGWVFVSRGQITKRRTATFSRPSSPTTTCGCTSSNDHHNNWLDCIAQPRAADLRRRDRPSLGHDLPPGQHRHPAGPRAELGPAEGSSSSATSRPTAWSASRCVRPGTCNEHRLTNLAALHRIFPAITAGCTKDQLHGNHRAALETILDSNDQVKVYQAKQKLALLTGQAGDPDKENDRAKMATALAEALIGREGRQGQQGGHVERPAAQCRRPQPGLPLSGVRRGLRRSARAPQGDERFRRPRNGSPALGA